jgi:predicted enzyme related to lactoylglutathione lyase
MSPEATTRAAIEIVYTVVFIDAASGDAWRGDEFCHPKAAVEDFFMFAKLNHVAIVSDNYAAQGVFYRALFDLKSGANARFDASALALGDGYVGMNINPRAPGRQAGLDHFGLQVEDVEIVRARIAKKWPKIEIVTRPGNRPFAALGLHDPSGNYFDLSQSGMKNRAQIYEKPAWEQDRVFSHFALRALEAEMLATFYHEVFELELTEQNGAYTLSDGRISFVIIPWKISDYNGSGIERPALDHLGFEVESIAEFQNDLKTFQRNPDMRPKSFDNSDEGAVRKKLFERTNLGDLYMSDLDGVLLAVRERAAA